MSDREFVVSTLIFTYVLIGFIMSQKFHNRPFFATAACIVFWPVVFVLGFFVGGQGEDVASIDAEATYVDPNDFVGKWLERKTGKEFREYQSTLYTSLADVLTRPLVKTGKFEGLGGCTCGIPPGCDVRFYISEELFFTICPKCDSWATFPTRAKLNSEN